MIYVNTALVQWFSKKQSTLEPSVFGIELVTMKQGIDALICLRHMLRMMGISMSGLSYVYENNK